MKTATLLNPIPRGDITFNAFADGGVLHRAGSHRLWVLNITAATLWCLLDGQTDPAALARAYGARFGLGEAAARQDVAAMLAQFGRWGLLSSGAPADRIGQPAARPSAPRPVARPRTEAIKGLPRTVMALGGLFWGIAIADEDLSQKWRKLFRHLRIESDPAATNVELAVVREDATAGGPFVCCENGVVAEDGLSRDEVFPGLYYRLFERGMAALNHRLIFHAAAVARNGRALLLPAPSGSGKSTLAAALTASGWTYLSDELAVVDPQTLCVEPFALPIGLKDKSMAALAAFVPALEDLPRHVRADGVGLRYLAPPAAPPEGALPVAALVFPCYATEAPGTLAECQPLEALAHLAPTGSSSRPLAAEDIAATLELASLPAYRLEFSNLDAAVAQMNRLAGEQFGG